MNGRGFIGSRQESTRDDQMTTPRGLDLNFPPPEQTMGLIGGFVGSTAHEMQAQEHGQLEPQLTNSAQFIDDEISIISPTVFSEARKNRLRNRQGPQIMNENIGVHPGYGPMSNEDMEFHSSYGQMQLARDMHVRYGYGNSEWTPVPISVVPDPSDIRTNLQVIETVEEKELESEVPPVAATLNCPICISPLSEATTTRCGHVFCKPCIETAIKAQHKCPTCRRKLKKNDIIRIYLPSSA